MVPRDREGDNQGFITWEGDTTIHCQNRVLSSQDGELPSPNCQVADRPFQPMITSHTKIFHAWKL